MIINPFLGMRVSLFVRRVTGIIGYFDICIARGIDTAGGVFACPVASDGSLLRVEIKICIPIIEIQTNWGQAIASPLVCR